MFPHEAVSSLGLFENLHVDGVDNAGGSSRLIGKVSGFSLGDEVSYGELSIKYL